MPTNGAAVETDHTPELMLLHKGLMDTEHGGGIAVRRHQREFHQEQAATLSGVEDMHSFLDPRDGITSRLKLS